MNKVRRLVKKGQSFVHLTAATSKNINKLLQSGIQPSTVPISRVKGDRNSSISSGLSGVLVDSYPCGFGFLPHLTNNILPLALRIETTADCQIIANDSFVHDDFIFNTPQEAMETALLDQAGFVLDLYGTTVLQAPAAGDSSTWKITGMQIFDDCLLRHHGSPVFTKQRKDVLELIQLAYFQQLLRVPQNHEISRMVTEKSYQLCAENPFVPFDNNNVSALFSRCGWKDDEEDTSMFGFLKPTAKPIPLLSEAELNGLRTDITKVTESVQRYMRSCPEPVGCKPPSASASEPERSNKFDEYAKAKYLKKPPPPPPVTFGSGPVAGPVKINPNKLLKKKKKKGK